MKCFENDSENSNIIGTYLNFLFSQKSSLLGTLTYYQWYIILIISIILNSSISYYILTNQPSDQSNLPYQLTDELSQQNQSTINSLFPKYKQIPIPVGISTLKLNNIASTAGLDLISTLDTAIQTSISTSAPSNLTYADLCLLVPTLHPDGTTTDACYQPDTPLLYQKRVTTVNGKYTWSTDIRKCIDGYSKNCVNLNQGFKEVSDDDIMDVVKSGRNQQDGNLEVDTRKMFYTTEPGNIIQNEVNNEWNIDRAVTVKWEYLCDPNRSSVEKCNEFEHAVQKYLSSINNNEFEMLTYSNYDLEQILESEPLLDQTLVNIAIIIMFAVIVPMIIRISPKNLRIVAQLSGVVVVAWSVYFSYYVSVYLGQQTQSMHVIIPFIQSAIGLQIILMIMFGSIEASEEQPDSVKMQVEYLQASTVKISAQMLILIIVGLLGGLYSKFQAIRSLCAHMSIGLAIIFINILLLLMPIIKQDVHRLNDKKNECCDCVGIGCSKICLPTKPKTEYVSMVYGDIDYLEEEQVMEQEGRMCCKGKFDIAQADSIIVRFVSEYLSEFQKYAKQYMIALMVVVIGLSIWGVTFNKLDQDFSTVYPKQSDSYQDFKNWNNYFNETDEKKIFVSGDFKSQMHQTQLLKLEEKINEQGIHSKVIWTSFQHDFRTFVDSSVNPNNFYGCFISGARQDLSNVYINNQPLRMVPETIQNDCLMQFLQSQFGHKQKNDLVFTNNELSAAILKINFPDENDHESRIKIMNDMRSIQNQGPNGTIIYQDQYLQVDILDNLTQDFSRSILIMLGILLLLFSIIIQSLNAAIQLVINIIAISVELFTLNYLYGFYCNVETLPQLLFVYVLAIQFHIAQMFKNSMIRGSIEDRSFYALQWIGPINIILIFAMFVSMLIFLISNSQFMFVNLSLLLSCLGLVAVHSLIFTPSFLIIQSPESINKPAWNKYLQTEEPEPIVSLDEDVNGNEKDIIEGETGEIEYSRIDDNADLIDESKEEGKDLDVIREETDS